MTPDVPPDKVNVCAYVKLVLSSTGNGSWAKNLGIPVRAAFEVSCDLFRRAGAPVIGLVGFFGGN